MFSVVRELRFKRERTVETPVSTYNYSLHAYVHAGVCGHAGFLWKGVGGGGGGGGGHIVNHYNYVTCFVKIDHITRNEQLRHSTK